MFGKLLNVIGRNYVRRLTQAESARQRHLPNERAVEYRFLFEQVAELEPRTVLDVGTGKTCVPAMISQCGCIVTAVDNVKDFWPHGLSNRHFSVQDIDITRSTLTERFDLISCISVLEHIEDYEAAVDTMCQLLEIGGHLVLTFPYSESAFHPNVYQLPESAAYGQRIPYICRSYSRTQLDAWLARNHLRLVKMETWRFYAGAYWSCGSREPRPIRVDSHERHQLACLLIQRMP